LAALYRAQSYLYHQGGRHEQALVAAEQAARIASAVDEAGLFADATSQRGRLLQLLGQGEAAGATLTEAVELAEAAGDLNVLAEAACYLAISLLVAGEFERGMVYSQRALAAWEQTGDSVMAIRGLGMRGWPATPASGRKRSRTWSAPWPPLRRSEDGRRCFRAASWGRCIS
jgi:tetratricopeptide (TPR) repeat protein